MKKSVALLSVLLMIFLLTGFTAAHAQKKPVVLKMVIATPEGDWPQTFRDKELAKRFNERAKGEYKIEVYAGGALAKLPEFFDAVRVGAVDMQFSNWGMFSFMDPRMGLIELPFLFESNMAQNSALKQMLPLYEKLLQEKFNAKGLAMTNTGGLGMWAQKPIKTLEDMKDLLTASVSPVTSTLIKGLGASPVTIPFMDIYESLQKKVVDAAAQSAHGGVVFSFPDACKNFTAFYGVPAPAGWSINMDVWKKMPANIQKILLEETQKSAEWMNKVVVTELADKDLKSFKDKGVTVYFLPKAERDRWAKQLDANKQAELGKFGELGQQIKKIADEANKKFPYKADKTAM